jgi:hypothetical protein
MSLFSNNESLVPAQPRVLLLRDGELVLYRRTRSLMYQCRFKLADGKWHRFSTGNESPRVSWRPVGLSQTDMTA